MMGIYARLFNPGLQMYQRSSLSELSTEISLPLAMFFPHASVVFIHFFFLHGLYIISNPTKKAGARTPI